MSFTGETCWKMLANESEHVVPGSGPWQEEMRPLLVFTPAQTTCQELQTVQKHNSQNDIPSKLNMGLIAKL